MEPNTAVARRFYEAMHRMDPVALLTTLSDSFVGHVSEGLPGGHGGTYVGGDRMLRDCWGPVHRKFGAMPHPDRLLEVEPDVVVALGEYRGSVPETGRTFTAAFAHVLRIADGQIIELRQITDTQRWAEALSNVDVAASAFDAVRARDIDALLAIYSDDIVIRDDPALPYGGEHRGREGAIRHAFAFAEAWDRYQGPGERDPQEVLVDDGERVVGTWSLRAVRGQQRLDQTTVTILEIVDRKVVTLHMLHSDTGELVSFLDTASAAVDTRPA